MAEPPDPSSLPRATSIWRYKPWWCQPWSILLTGVLVTTASWLLLQRWWITLPLSVAVGLWWWLFLVLIPASSGPLTDPADLD